MPLQLEPENMRPQQLCWDPEIPAEVEDAEKEMASLKARGFVQKFWEPGNVLLEPPKRDPNKFIFRILSQNGDDVLVWDKTKLQEVRDAAKKFTELIKKGYQAFTCTAGKKGHKIDAFDPLLEEILLAQDGESKEVLMVPSTVPG